MSKSAPLKGSARRKSKRLIQGFLALLVIGGIASAWYLSGGSDSSSSSATSPTAAPATVDPKTLPASLKNRLVLPAKPLPKRPFTLEPASFKDPEVQKSYQAARDVPQVLEHMPCYCGCFANSGHRNNLDCFKDNHGEHCALCRAIAVESKAMNEQGLPLEQINIAINEKYAPRIR
jgi:hypothetical protein